jgi:prephenate dehydratase
VPQIHPQEWLEADRSGRYGGRGEIRSETGDGTMAALSPPLAAKLYNLDVLEENVEDTDPTSPVSSC